MTMVKMQPTKSPKRLLRRGAQTITSHKIVKSIQFTLPVIFLFLSYFMLFGGNEGSESFSVKTSKSKAATKRLEFVHITKTGGSAIEKAGAKDGIIWGLCHYMNMTEVGCSAPDVPYKAPNYQSYALTSPWHTPPKLLKRYVDEKLYPYNDADLFVVIRNPYSRMLSEYYCPWGGFQGRLRKDTVHDKNPNDPDIMNKWVESTITRLSAALEEFNARKEGDMPKEQAKGLNEDKHILAQKHSVNQAEYVYDGDKVLVNNVIHYENLSTEFDALMKKYGINTSLPPKEKGGTYTEKNKGRLSHMDLYPKTIALINKFAKEDFIKFGYRMVEKFEKSDGYSLEAIVDGSPFSKDSA